MEPQIIERPEMTLVGIVGSAPDVSQLDIVALWQRFTEHSKNVKHQIEGKGYEIHIQEETAPSMHFCLIGVEVREIEDIPIELFAKVVPPCRYAVFTHHFKDGGFDYAFKTAYDWLGNSEYAAAHAFDIQCYDERFKGPDDPESVLEIYLPITSKPG